MKQCIIIAGPNGAGKTTFAQEFLPQEGHTINFLNADLIASGLSPFAPERAAIEASKLMLVRIGQYCRRHESFGLESTLSGRSHLRRVVDWQGQGYHVILHFLRLASVELAVERVRLRVQRGGHSVPEGIVRRRYARGLANLQSASTGRPSNGSDNVCARSRPGRAPAASNRSSVNSNPTSAAGGSTSASPNR